MSLLLGGACHCTPECAATTDSCSSELGVVASCAVRRGLVVAVVCIVGRGWVLDCRAVFVRSSGLALRGKVLKECDVRI